MWRYCRAAHKNNSAWYIHNYCSEYDVTLPRQILGQMEQWLTVMGWHVSLLTRLVSRALHETIYSDIFLHFRFEEFTHFETFFPLHWGVYTLWDVFHFALRSLHTLWRFSLCIEGFAHFVKLLALHWKVLNILSFICAVQSWQICMVDKPAHFDEELCIEKLALLALRHLRILHRGLHTFCI